MSASKLEFASESLDREPRNRKKNHRPERTGAARTGTTRPAQGRPPCPYRIRMFRAERRFMVLLSADDGHRSSGLVVEHPDVRKFPGNCKPRSVQSKQSHRVRS